MTYKPKKQENSIDFYSLNDFEMKVLLATEKPFAKVASDGIREIVEKAGYELVVLEKYTDKSELLKSVADVDAIIIRSDKITATEQTKKSINYDLLSKMPKGATIVNTARKEVIDEEGLAKVLAERTDLKYVTDIAADMQVVLNEKFGNRVFATPKKMGAETQEANVNAALAAANQIVAFFTKGENRFQVNKW